MFRVLSIIGFVAAFAGVGLHFVARKCRCDDVLGPDRKLRLLDPVRGIVLLVSLLFIEQKLTIAGALRKLVFIVAVVCFCALAITGFVPRIFLDEQISGWWLMIHATAAGVFAACMAALAVMWADKCRLDKNYWPWLNRIIRRTPQSVGPPQKYELGQKVAFWLIIALSLPVILSAVLSMFPLFGTHWQEVLAEVHRYCTLAIAITGIIYLYLLVLTATYKIAGKQ